MECLCLVTGFSFYSIKESDVELLWPNARLIDMATANNVKMRLIMFFNYPV